jgi:hypothetical protein
MYQPYPAGGQPPVPQQPPKPVLTAVKLMYAGAGLEVLGLILNLIDAGKAGASGIATGVGGAAIGVALWLWMAAANRAGKNWARITSTVFFGIDCVFLLLGLIGLGALSAAGANMGVVVPALLVSIVVWLVGLGSIVMLWRQESSSYFRAMSGGS